jgi:hypothetical protein
MIPLGLRPYPLLHLSFLIILLIVPVLVLFGYLI